jgi:hypothetical protein
MAPENDPYSETNFIYQVSARTADYVTTATATTTTTINITTISTSTRACNWLLAVVKHFNKRNAF